MEIDVMHGSLTEAHVEALVNAANSQGSMGGGVAGFLKKVAGAEVEREARAQAPIPIGQAVITSAGRLEQFRAIVHAPTMERPAMRIPPENVYQATQGALRAADEAGFKSLAIPGMGTGVGGVAHQEAARQMVQAIRDHKAENLEKVVLVDIDEAMVEAWRKALASAEA
jgi:O-acetyl-ADP-ribose deacetylase (regulator of RNase III)